MNKKNIFSIFYYIFGTFLVVFIFSVVSVNFVRDSKLLGKPSEDFDAIEAQPQQTITPVKGNVQDSKDGTTGITGIFTYDKEQKKPAVQPTKKPVVTPTAKPTEAITPHPTPVPTPTPAHIATPKPTETVQPTDKVVTPNPNTTTKPEDTKKPDKTIPPTTTTPATTVAPEQTSIPTTKQNNSVNEPTPTPKPITGTVAEKSQ